MKLNPLIQSNVRHAAVAACLGLTTVLAGCSLWGGSSAKPVPADLGANVPVLGVRQAWSAKLGGSVSGLLNAQVNGSTVTLVTTDGHVVSLDARTGADNWRASLGEAASSGAGSDGNIAAVVTRTNALVAMEGGRERWRETLSAQVFTPPLVAGGRVFVLGADRSVSAFDAATGKRLWALQRQGEPLVLRHVGVLQPVGDTLLVGFAGRLQGINPDTGAVRWESILGSARGANDVERLIELVGRPSRVADSVCARAYQSVVGCVNVARGTTTWTQPSNGVSAVHGDADTVVGAESNGTLMAWNRANGTRLWSTDRLKYRSLTAPLVLGRSVVVGDSTGIVHLLSREDGKPLNRFTVSSSGVALAPVVAADTLIVVATDGTVAGYRPE